MLFFNITWVCITVFIFPHVLISMDVKKDASQPSYRIMTGNHPLTELSIVDSDYSVVKRLSFDQEVNGTDFSPDETLLAVGLKDRRVVFFQNDNNQWKKLASKKNGTQFFREIDFHDITFIDSALCLSYYCDTISFISIPTLERVDLKLPSKKFIKSIRCLRKVNNNYMFIQGEQGHIYTLKQIDEKWELKKIISLKKYLPKQGFECYYKRCMPSDNGKLLAIPHKTNILIFKEFEPDQWWFTTQVKAKENTQNILCLQAFEDEVLTTFEQLKKPVGRSFQQTVQYAIQH